MLVTGFYFAKEREWLLDQHIETIASGLLANELKDAELSEIDDIIADTLFDQPRTILLNIYDHKKNLIYQNTNSQNILGSDLPPLTGKLFTFISDNHKTRFLNLELPNHKILQVGLLLDKQMSQLWAMNKRISLLLVCMIVFILTVAWILANILVRPLQELTTYIHTLASNVEKNTSTPTPLPPMLERLKRNRDKEIRYLWESLNYFRKAVESKIKLTKTTVAQMAHELKTPLTIIRNSFEFLQVREKKRSDENREKVKPPETFRSSDQQFTPNQENPMAEKLIAEKLISDAIEETDRLNVTISRFLEWSRYESIDSSTDIHALKLSTIVNEILQSVSKAYPEHQFILNFDPREENQVLAHPEDLRQLVRNLIENAFKYSSDQKIIVTINKEWLIIENSSPAVPEKVFQRLGEPFNAGKTDGNKSIGLGLAWVSSICKRYHWDFEFVYRPRPTHYSENTSSGVACGQAIAKVKTSYN